MKRLISALLLTVISTVAMAQKQKEIRIMLEQVLKLKLQTTLVKQGNRDSEKKLDQISSNKKGSYSIFDRYFTSLKQVNPQVGGNETVQKTKDLFLEIRKIFPGTIDRATNSGLFEFYEVNYFSRAYDRLKKDCEDILSSMNTVTTSGKTSMTDDERMQRIDQLYKRMVDAYTFCKRFCTDIECTKASRQQSKNDSQLVRRLYGKK